MPACKEINEIMFWSLHMHLKIDIARINIIIFVISFYWYQKYNSLLSNYKNIYSFIQTCMQTNLILEIKI